MIDGSALVRSGRVAAAVVLAAFALGACSSTPSTTELELKLRSLDSLTTQQAHCVAVSLRHTLTSHQLHTVETADGRGGITDAALTAKITDSVTSCVVVPSTTVGSPNTSTVSTLEP